MSVILNFGCQRVCEHSDWREMIILATRTPREGLYIAREEIIARELNIHYIIVTYVSNYTVYSI